MPLHRSRSRGFQLRPDPTTRLAILDETPLHGNGLEINVSKRRFAGSREISEYGGSDDVVRQFTACGSTNYLSCREQEGTRARLWIIITANVDVGELNRRRRDAKRAAETRQKMLIRSDVKKHTGPPLVV